MADDDFAHFAKGTLQDSGAKLYVSAKGNVQMLDRLDLDGDGWPDVAFTNNFDGVTQAINSYIYWNLAGKLGATKKELPTVGAMDMVSADLNDDGHVDLVFANFSANGPVHSTNSYIYWGPLKVVGAPKKTELPTHGARCVAIADLNRDGHLDLFFCNHTNGTKHDINSYIYWGSATGFSATKKKELPTVGAAGVSIADLNKDDQLDLVTSNRRLGNSFSINSYIYWGHATGYSATNRKELPTHGARGNAVADLDGDGALDIVFGNQRLGTNTNTNSYVLWGKAPAYSARAELPTKYVSGVSVGAVGPGGGLGVVFNNFMDTTSGKSDISSYVYAWGGTSFSLWRQIPAVGPLNNLVADFNGDGVVDILLANNDSSKGHNINSYCYWGTKAGPSTTNPLGLPTHGAASSGSADPGAVHDRKPVQTFTSRVLDSGPGTPTYISLSWKASVPNKTSLKLQLRSASSALGLASAPWYGPTSTSDHYIVTPTSGSAAVNKTHNGDRYVQYRATFSHDFGNTPVLDRVAVTYK